VSKRRARRSRRRTAGSKRPLAIICGGGAFPGAVADAAKRGGRPAILFPLRGFADSYVEKYPHTWIDIGKFGGIVRAIREAGCREIVMIGTLVRPQLSQLRFDLAAIRLLPRMARLYRGGDNRLLSGIAKIFEERGLRLRGAHEVAPELLVPAGAVGRLHPRPQHKKDIRLGFRLLRTVGEFDVGQAAVIADQRVVAIEAAEGTGQMLARVAELRRNRRLRLSARAGVLVKAPKPRQDRRFDLPAIGADTVEQAGKAGLAGIAVEAGGALVADIAALARAADKAGLFVVGVPRAKGSRR
jgi:DUF1009 family protein